MHLEEIPKVRAPAEQAFDRLEQEDMRTREDVDIAQRPAEQAPSQSRLAVPKAEGRVKVAGVDDAERPFCTCWVGGFEVGCIEPVRDHYDVRARQFGEGTNQLRSRL